MFTLEGANPANYPSADLNSSVDQQNYYGVLALNGTIGVNADYQVAYTIRYKTRQKHHVDADSGFLRLEAAQTNNGEERKLPLTPELRAVLMQQLERTQELERTIGRLIPGFSITTVSR